jgi:hypothetical protein
MIHVSTSPLPPFAIPAFPVLLKNNLPSGVEMLVNRPFRTM